MNDELPTYEIRLSEPAEADIEAVTFWLLGISEQSAGHWTTNLRRALESLTQLPNRCPLAPESGAMGGGVRQLFFGKRRSAYRILYRVVEVQEDEPAHILVMRVRHGAQQR